MQIKLPSPPTLKLAVMAARRNNRLSIAVFAGLFLFAQLTLAAQGCVLAFDREASAHDASMAEEQCGNLPMEGAVCLMHCLGQDESASTTDHHFTAIVSSPAARPLDFVLSATRAPARTLCDSRLHVPRPSQIRYCSYQT